MDKDKLYLTQAKEKLKEGGYTCVLNKDGALYTSHKHGIVPLLEFLDSDTDFKDACAADRVVGRAAAFLYVIMGVRCVHSDLMSKTAMEVFNANGVTASYDTLTETIFNRTMTGLCPMENAVLSINDPYQALSALRLKLDELSRH